MHIRYILIPVFLYFSIRVFAAEAVNMTSTQDKGPTKSISQSSQKINK